MSKKEHDEFMERQQKRIDEIISKIDESLVKRYENLLEEEDKFRNGE